jgi:hypothetical protein
MALKHTQADLSLTAAVDENLLDLPSLVSCMDIDMNAEIKVHIICSNHNIYVYVYIYISTYVNMCQHCPMISRGKCQMSMAGDLCRISELQGAWFRSGHLWAPVAAVEA